MTSPALALITAANSSPTLLLVIKVTIIATVGLVVAWFSRNARAALRHFLLAAMFLVTVVLPFVFFAPSIEIPISIAGSTQSVSSEQPEVLAAIDHQALASPNASTHQGS